MSCASDTIDCRPLTNFGLALFEPSPQDAEGILLHTVRQRYIFRLHPWARHIN